ncbi:MAG: hypothetical protein HZA78_01945 [Candidatus Schekmanbacteria bacterium]|nr:hypothetical protein [Candidatus Schekmanbacteria bacterium]
MKKGIVSGIVVSALTLASVSPGWGMQLFNDKKLDSLVERLQKKGVLTEEEVREFKAADQKSANEHSFKAGVRLQLRYEYKEGDIAERTSDLNIRRARISFEGNMYPEVAYKFEVALDGMEDLSMKDASLTFGQLGPYAQLRVGQFKTPFSRQRIASSGKLQMIDRSPIEKLYPGRDIGFELSGKNILGVLDYGVAMEAGVGDKRKFKNTDNSEWWYDGRIACHPLGEVPLAEGDVQYTDNFRFEIAANGLYAPSQVAFGERSIHDMFLADEVYTAQAAAIKAIGNGTKLSGLPAGMIGDTIIWGPELTIIYKGLSLAMEYYKATYTPEDTVSFRKIHSEGYFVQGGAFVIPKTLELTARYDRFDRNTEAKTQSDTREYTVGVNYFPTGDHNYKWQANYIWRKEDWKEIDNNSLVMNLQVAY